MAQLRQDYSKFAERNVAILAIGPETPEVFQAYWQKEKLPFIGLPDPTHSVLKLYGQEIKLFKFGRMPAQAIIDRQGMVRYVHYGDAMSDIPTTDELLALLDELAAETKAV